MPFPVATRTLSIEIQGQQTDVVLFGYEDHIMVTVTQIGSMGTLLYAKKEEAYGGGVTFNVATLMGRRDEPLLAACARQLAEMLSQRGVTRPLLLSLGLRDHSAGILKDIIGVVMDNPIW